MKHHNFEKEQTIAILSWINIEAYISVFAKNPFIIGRDKFVYKTAMNLFVCKQNPERFGFRSLVSYARKRGGYTYMSSLFLSHKTRDLNLNQIGFVCKRRLINSVSIFIVSCAKIPINN